MIENVLTTAPDLSGQARVSSTLIFLDKMLCDYKDISLLDIGPARAFKAYQC